MIRPHFSFNHLFLMQQKSSNYFKALPTIQRQRLNRMEQFTTATIPHECSDTEQIHSAIQSTENWIHQIVVGEKLCPFVAPLLLTDNNTNAAANVRSKSKQIEHMAVPGDNTRSNNYKNCSKIRIFVTSAQNETELMNDIKNELDILLIRPITAATTDVSNQVQEQQQYHHETTLIVFDPKDENNISHPLQIYFQDYYEFVRLSWEIQSQTIVDTGYVNDVQIVLFHPKATHQTYTDLPTNNNSNRSPLKDDEDSDGHAGGSAGDYTIRSPYPTIHLLRQKDVLNAVSSGKYPNLQYLPVNNQKRLHKLGYKVCQQRLLDCYKTK